MPPVGAHVQTTRKHTNDRQMSRVHAIQPLSSKLNLSASSYATKVHALTSAAWPKGLHTIAATTVSLQTFVTLRASAIKGLNADGSGVSSFVHLGLTECPTADPHFWSVQQTLRLVRDCGIEGCHASPCSTLTWHQHTCCQWDLCCIDDANPNVGLACVQKRCYCGHMWGVFPVWELHGRICAEDGVCVAEVRCLSGVSSPGILGS